MHAVPADASPHSNSYKRIHSLLASVGWDNNGLVFMFKKNLSK